MLFLHLNCLNASSLIQSPFLKEIQDISWITSVVRAVNEQKGSSISASSGTNISVDVNMI